jgi:hypothetical protein
MLEQIAAIIAVLLIIPGWAIALIAIFAYLWRILSRSDTVSDEIETRLSEWPFTKKEK